MSVRFLREDLFDPVTNGRKKNEAGNTTTRDSRTGIPHASLQGEKKTPPIMPKKTVITARNLKIVGEDRKVVR
jgi:hypothetical protein